MQALAPSTALPVVHSLSPECEKIARGERKSPVRELTPLDSTPCRHSHVPECEKRASGRRKPPPQEAQVNESRGLRGRVAGTHLLDSTRLSSSYSNSHFPECEKTARERRKPLPRAPECKKIARGRRKPPPRELIPLTEPPVVTLTSQSAKQSEGKKKASSSRSTSE